MREGPLIPLLGVLVLCMCSASSTHIKGSFTSDEFFKFLVKFGFQKTDRHQREATYGYIFGNITSNHNFSVPITFAVLDRPYFLEYYQNRLLFDKHEACKRMFTQLKTKAFDVDCSGKGKDFLRKIPCPKNQLCVDEDSPWNVVKGHQFTYAIQNLIQPS